MLYQHVTRSTVTFQTASSSSYILWPDLIQCSKHLDSSIPFKSFRLMLCVRILKHETGYITLYISCDICLKAKKSVSRITHLSISSMLSLNRSHLLMKTYHWTKQVPFIIYSLSTTEKYTLAHMQTTETHINTLITLCSDNDNREPGRLNSSSAFS